MKRVKPPQNGSKFNAQHKFKDEDMVSVAESHEERLSAHFPSLVPEIERLKAIPAPASFKTVPGKITGKQLVQLGVPGICPHCYMLEDLPNPKCMEHLENSGGGNSWKTKAA